MFNKEEAKNIRQEYWNQFKSWSGGKRHRTGKQGKWMMNDTGMRQIRLKFHFDEQYALAALEVDTKNLEKRIEIWEKLESLKPRLTEKSELEFIWDLEVPLIGDKTVSRIFREKRDVNIYDKKCWKEVNSFLFASMSILEEFFLEYRDFLKYQ